MKVRMALYVRVLLGLPLILTLAWSVSAHAADLEPLKPFLISGRDARGCQETVAGESFDYVSATLAAMQRCLNDLQTGQLSGDPQTLCIGNAGAPPSHPQTAIRLAAAEASLREGIAGSCTDALAAALRLCQQAGTLNELQDCIVATHASQARILLQALARLDPS